MPLPNILVVVVDGLRAAALGAYGNTTFPTPALDDFAATSLILDGCYSPAIELDAIYEAMWHARHPLHRRFQRNDSHAALSLPKLLADRGFETTLITDEPSLVQLEATQAFRECIQLRTDDSTATARATDISSTRLADVFAPLIEIVERTSSKRRRSASEASNWPAQLIWLHAQGMFGPWDAPLSLQESLLDEETFPVESATVPQILLASDNDLDLAFRYSTAYAAQVMVLDQCWQELMSTLEAAGASDSWLVMLLGARGFSLGEHGRIGGLDDRLPVEHLHVPWLIRFPDSRGQLARRPSLVSHVDILPTLAELTKTSQSTVATSAGLSILPLADPADPPCRASLLSTNLSSSNDESISPTYSLRTDAWCLRGALTKGDPTAIDREAVEPALFVRPDDLWEANDVAKLCPDVVDELQRIAQACIDAAISGAPIEPLLAAAAESAPSP
ncbi:MAG: sulfatase-like hydrolase/transferase [Pirellulales bacterium]